MGEHARRATRRKTPLVAAAAGVGTVAAMLAGPLPASAAAPAFVLDPGYGGINGAPKGVAMAGLSNSPGVDAVNLTVSTVNYRYVLSQPKSGIMPVTLTRFFAGGAPDAAFGGSTGKVTLAGIPANTTVSKLLTDGTNLWVVGQNGFNVVVGKYDTAGALVSSGFNGSTGWVQVATGLSGSGTTFSIVDAKLQTHLGDDGAATGSGVNADDTNAVLVGINASSVASGVTTPSAWLLRVSGNGAGLDANFGTAGKWQIPNAISLGGFGVRPTSDTANKGGIFVAATIPGAQTTDEPQSQLVQTLSSGAAFGGFTGTNLETYFDNAGWANEALGDIVEAGANGPLLVSGRISTGYFVAKVTIATGALDTTFGANGVSSLVPSSCATGTSQVALDNTTTPTLVYLATDRTCANNMPEFVRYTFTGGAPDTTFNNGSAVWSPNVPVNARPLVATTAGKLTFGSMSATDAASGQATTPVAPGVTAPAGTPGSPVTSGQLVTLSTTVTGLPSPSLQWQWAPANSTTWTNIPDATGPYYSFRATLAQSGYQYRVVATNEYGQTATSTATSITVYAGPPTVTKQPMTTTVSAGSPASFTVGWAGEPDSTVQWQASANNGVSWQNVVGATSATVVIPNPPIEYNGFQYRAVLTNPNGTANSNPATLIVTPKMINISKQPSDQSADEGHDATFAVTANGNSALTYQWQWSKTGADNSFQNVPGATSASWTWKNVKASDDGTVVQVKITDAGNNVEYSTKAKLTVKSSSTPEPGKSVWGDYNGDGKTDIAAFKDGQFYWNGSSPENFGKAGDKLVVGNFDDDAAADKAVVRGNTWMTDGNPNVSFGKSTDWPVSGDFDGDGKTDVAVWRPSNGTWYVNGGDTQQWGQAGDIPVPGDYDGDGSDEFAVFRPSNGTWYIYGVGKFAHGRAGDIPVRGDWNGDGSTDILVYRPSNSTWYPRGGASVTYGAKGDVPLAGDFDGNGKSDLAVYRPSNTTWYFSGKPSVKFGGSGWWPIPGVK